MKKIFAPTVIILFLFSCSQEITETKVSSPLGEIELTFDLVDGVPTYSATFGGSPVIRPSSMGFELLDQENLDGPFELISADITHVSDPWKCPWGRTAKGRK